MKVTIKSTMEQNTTTQVEISSNVPFSPDLIPDMPPGPLDKYRKSARFNWKLLRILLEGEELLAVKNKVWRTVESEPEFQPPKTTPSCDEQKRKASRMLMRLHTLKHSFLPPEVVQGSYKRKTRHIMTMNEALALVNRNVSVKFALGVTLFSNALPSLGTDRHLKYCHAAWRGDILSCFAITEISHGSNTKKLRTTATYDPKTEEFVINTPDFQATKIWAGNLGRTSNYAVVFAQLKTADGENHGLHAFIVPVRDPATLLPYPGVTVGDMGEKIGLNGIDNGFIMFNHYRIPKENLLNRTGDVNEEGSYESSFSNPQKILGAALENLSAGRLAIAQESTNTLSCAITIAIRFAAVRRQFGSQEDEELPIMEYPLHQWRLFPYLAASCVFKIFVMDFTDQYLETVEKSYSSSGKLNELSAVAAEIHAIVSSCKPVLSWTCRDAIQESREACGGYGYLKAANLGDLRNDHDPSVTYEGDNTILIQQTSNWLLRQWNSTGDILQRSPLGTIEFLDRANTILNYRFIGTSIKDVVNHNFISSAFQWLLCYLIRETDKEMNLIQSQGVDRFTARTRCQIYKARPLSIAFAENNALTYCWKRLNRPEVDSGVKTILEKLYLIYGLWCIDRYLTYFYQGGFAEGSHLASLVRDGLISLNSSLVPDAVAVVDAIAPPDFVLNSALGNSDGRLYDHLERTLLQREAMERPSWWKEIISPITSKL